MNKQRRNTESEIQKKKIFKIVYSRGHEKYELTLSTMILISNILLFFIKCVFFILNNLTPSYFNSGSAPDYTLGQDGL